MAQLDMKNAVIRIRDGDTENTAAVNLTAGYIVGDDEMVIDGTALEADDLIGRRFTVVGSTDTIHTITAATPGSGAVTDITFTPDLADTVANDAVIAFYPHELEIHVGEGNLTYSEKVTRQYTKNRGVLDTVRDGDEEPVDVKLDIMWEFLKASSGETPTPEDCLKKRGGAAAWTSSSDDACEPYAVDVEIAYIPDCGSEEPEFILLEDFRYESIDHDLKAGSLSVSGKCNKVEATVTRGY